jgi:hypothetical protein
MKTRILAYFAAATLLTCSQAGAAFHLWQIRELYTNLDGSVQFIELFTSSSSQQFVGGRQIQITQQGTGTVHTFTIPADLPGDSSGRAFIIGTANLPTFGGPTPDFTIPATFAPDNSAFLFPNGGTISFFGANSGAYTALPTNGTLSYTFPTGTTAVNSPRNFSNTTGTVVPEPTTWGLLGLGGLAVTAFFRRRRAA